jgi:hypothetical protein
MTTANPNNRASLLAGLRTGGVRSVSLNAPHTAAPAGAFNVARYPSQSHPTNIFPEEEEDNLPEIPRRQPVYSNRHIPMTAAVDAPNNHFANQQTAQRPMNPNSIPFSPAFPPHMMAQPQVQMQMIQLEMMRLQAMQAQQLQEQMLAQAHLQQQQQQQQAQAAARERRTSLGFAPPATAGPTTSNFDLRAATLRRANQAEQLRAQLGVGNSPADHVPMTAALGGRFGSRTTSLNAAVDTPPPTPGYTTVISGGTSLGSLSSNNLHAQAVTTPSKSDSASSWRRGGNNNSVLSGNRAVSSPSVKVTPPPSDDEQYTSIPPVPSPISTSGLKFRPQPLRFSAAVSQPLPAVTIDTTDEDTDGETHSSGSSVKSGASNSSPTTPRSSSSNEMPLSPREEASKKLFEGLGIGRPVSATPSEKAQQQQTTIIVPRSLSTTPASGHRVVSQPTRQPRGPPSGAEELGPKNFATRIRRKAIGGLGMLLGARERREVEVF